MTHETIQIGFLSARPRIEFKENQNVLKAKDQEKVDMKQLKTATTYRVLSFHREAGLL